MATNIEKYNFKLELSNAHSAYGKKLANKERLGIDDENYRFKFFLLTAFNDILFDYLSPADDTDENFFTAAEARDILEHFNRIANTTITFTDFE